MSDNDIATVYMGRYMTMWDTVADARESWRAPTASLLKRSRTVWWRAEKVEFIDPPADVDVREVLKKDL